MLCLINASSRVGLADLSCRHFLARISYKLDHADSQKSGCGRQTAIWPVILSLSEAPVFTARGGFVSQWLVNRQSIRTTCIQTNLNADSHLAIGERDRLIVIGGWEELIYDSETCERGRRVEINAEVIEGSHPIPCKTPCFCLCVPMHLWKRVSW